ncbi:hypothetical protein GUJ93_ZPchr0013g34183 [Zizania palustris]|uniref:Uncharacterized protein n=1 Tax=Zizania palustris TaxID=103762 RepID=A0A8J6BXE9_ZIZPA|nr:hypothetical protein GUJ93_ZPchr0013g34183 [Zizania palustris]
MTSVEIVYNAVSVAVAVLMAIGFAIYAKKALGGMQSSEGICPEPVRIAHASAELRYGHQECSDPSSVQTDVV